MGKYLIHKAVETTDLRKSSPLAVRLAKDPHAVQRTFLRQLKHDGCNCIVIWNPDWHADRLEGLPVGNDGLLVLSRTGEVVHSMGHLRQDLQDMPPGVYLGEAWLKGLDFPEISGIFRRKTVKEDSALLQLQVFDGLTLKEWATGESEVPFALRWNRVCAWMQSNPYPAYMRRNRPEPPNYAFPDTVDKALRLAVAYQDDGGFDGLIYRDPMGKWYAGDSGKDGEIIKVKPRVRLTLRVTGYLDGKGKHAGRIGTLLVSYKGKEQGAGTGLKDSQRCIEDFATEWADKLVEIECLGVTADGFLREPVLLGIRHDVLEADA